MRAAVLVALGVLLAEYGAFMSVVASMEENE